MQNDLGLIDTTEDDKRDAARWRALMGCRMHFMGCAGFTLEGTGNDRAGITKVRPAVAGEERHYGDKHYLHFGMEFWSSHEAYDPEENKRWVGMVESFADWVILREKELNPLRNRAFAYAEGWGLFEAGDGMLLIEVDTDADPETAPADNDAALQLVTDRAAAGSEYHKRALALHGTSVEAL